ncbi:MAG: enoyl-CoA hydratase-related protein [Thermohalobaculum sp.]
MAKVLYEKDGRIGRITLIRPEVMNAIDDELPGALSAAVAEANADPEVHVMVLVGKGPAFCDGQPPEIFHWELPFKLIA